jgi:hypothetical protein
MGVSKQSTLDTYSYSWSPTQTCLYQACTSTRTLEFTTYAVRHGVDKWAHIAYMEEEIYSL